MSHMQLCFSIVNSHHANSFSYELRDWLELSDAQFFTISIQIRAEI